MPTTRPRVRREEEYSYSNKFLDKELTFQPAGDEVVATFKTEETTDAADALLGVETARISLVNPDRGFAILQIGDEESTDGLALAVEGSEAVGNVLPVMIDGDSGRRYFMPDELTVQFDESVSAERALEIITSHGSEVEVEQRTPGYYTISVPEGKGLFETIREFSALIEVLFAEPSEIGVDDELVDLKHREAEIADQVTYDDLIVDLRTPVPEGDEEASDVTAIPSDTRFGELWGLHNTGQIVNGTSGTPDADIDAPHAWNITKGSPNVIVSVIDTGADLDHPDLSTNLLPRGSEDWDFADLFDDEPWDGGSHGTHVSGTAVGVENGQGVVGVAPQARLMPLRVNLTSGMNQNRADAINYVANRAAGDPHRRYVINCSWKMSGDHAGVKMSIQNAVAKNVVVVFAAGNANRDIDVIPQYPAVYPEVIAVAATDQQDRRASFSNFGTKVDVSAPGVNTLSSVPDDAYGFKNGTSMASPHVAGLAALIWSRNPDLTNAEVRSIIEATTDNIDGLNPGFAGQLGTGRINAYRALRQTPPPKLEPPILREFRFPQVNRGSSTGLALAPRFRMRWFGFRPALLFLTQKEFSESVYFLNPITGAVMHSVDPQANDTIGSMVWDGTAIRAANVTTGAGSINRINPYSGAQVGSIPAPPGRGEGLAFDGRWLYYSTIGTIHIIRPSTGTVQHSLPAPLGQSRSLTYGRGMLFSGNSSTGEIAVFDPWTGSVHAIIQAPGSGSHRAEGIAYDARRRELFVANQSENTIYVLRVSI